ncbi:putative fimbrin-like protein 2-like [Capsicum annuum]|nr:putative fimbrin-like protein 2-like [Capsicum annuum]KAF3676137.1 putative fimbrin-like protein 2-like [Capsicum annuum]
MADGKLFDDPNGPLVLHFFLETEMVPLCLACMDHCDELSQKVATLILMKILMQEKGMTYCCDGADRFFSIVQDDHETTWALQVLHFNIYGRLNVSQIKESNIIANKDTVW